MKQHLLALSLAAITIVPTRSTPLVCDTLTKRFGCKICTYSKCTDGKRTWTDRLMRCDDEECTRPKYEHSEHKFHEDEGDSEDEI